MSKSNIFVGKCYLCGRERLIYRTDSWKSQNGIRGGFRNFCLSCVSDWDWEINRGGFDDEL